MKEQTAARIGFGLTAAVTLFGVVAQLVQVAVGAWETPGTALPSMGVRLWRFFSYFTIQSNLLVLVAALLLTVAPGRDGRVWRVLRLDGLIGITVTGIVHWFLLRPLQDLSGWLYFTDKVVHVVVPLLAVLGWLALGPRPRIDWAVVLRGLIWPAAWLVYTMIVGAATAWYPYGFLDVNVNGAGPVAVTSVAITVLLFGFSCLFWLGDRKLPSRQDQKALVGG